jgi:hypothetical protein
MMRVVSKTLDEDERDRGATFHGDDLALPGGEVLELRGQDVRAHREVEEVRLAAHVGDGGLRQLASEGEADARQARPGGVLHHHVAHAACTEEADDLVRAEAHAGGQGHGRLLARVDKRDDRRADHSGTAAV